MKQNMIGSRKDFEVSDKPEPPVFPSDWVMHCPKAQDAAAWHRRLAPEKEFCLDDYAECAFVRQGVGMGCEACGKFLTRPHNGNVVERKFLPLIEQYYRDCEQYEKDLAVWEESIKEDKPPKPLVLDEEEAIVLLTLLAERGMIREKFEDIGIPLNISLEDLSEKLRKLCWEFQNDKI